MLRLKWFVHDPFIGAATTLKEPVLRLPAVLRGLVLALLLVAVPLTGCVQQDAPAALAPNAEMTGVNETRPDVKLGTFLPPVELGTVTVGSEPSVAVAPDGTVYVVSPGAGTWRSDDQGKTYKPLGKTHCLFGIPACPGTEENDANGVDGGGDASFAVAPNGTVWSAGLSGASGVVPVQSSLDKGASWSKGFDVAKKNSSDREWVTINSTGAVFVQWRDFGTGSTPMSGLLVRVTEDGGISWRDSVRITDDGHQGPIAHDPNGTWMYVAHVVGDDKLVVARSSDGARTWEDVGAAPLAADTFQFPITAVDSPGTVYVAYATGTLNPAKNYQADRFINAPSVRLITSKDHGASWSKPIQISPEGVPSVFPWIAAGAPGRVVVGWYEGTTSTPTVSPNVWHVKVVVSTTADAAKPVFVGGFVTDAPNHIGHICVVGSGCFPAQDRSLLDFFEVRILPDGSPVLAFVGDATVKTATVNIYATRLDGGTTLR